MSPKILHITPTYAPNIGGIETVVANLVKESRARGIKADIAHASVELKTFKRELSGDGATVWRVPVFPHRFLGVVPGLKKLIKQYDLLHVHDPQVTVLTLAALMSDRKIPKIFSTHGGFFHTANHAFFKQVHWQLSARFLLSRYNLILASSMSDLNTFSKVHAAAQLAANGVDVEAYRKIGATDKRTLRRWIYWGRLSSNKRLNLLVKVVAALKSRGVSVELTIAGPDFDGLAPELAREISQLQIDRQVRILGKLDAHSLAVEIADHGVYVTASAFEGFGLTTIEAMAAGLVVVCSDIEPLNTFVRPGYNGMLVDFANFDNHLNELVNFCGLDEARARILSDNARKVSDEYSWNVAFGAFEQAYRNLLPQMGGRSAGAE